MVEQGVPRRSAVVIRRCDSRYFQINATQRVGTSLATFTSIAINAQSDLDPNNVNSLSNKNRIQIPGVAISAERR